MHYTFVLMEDIMHWHLLKPFLKEVTLTEIISLSPFFISVQAEKDQRLLDKKHMK